MAISAALPRAAVHPWPMDKIPDPEVPERPTRRRFSGAYTEGASPPDLLSALSSTVATIVRPRRSWSRGAERARRTRSDSFGDAWPSWDQVSIIRIADASSRSSGPPRPSATSRSPRRCAYGRRTSGRPTRTIPRAITIMSFMVMTG
jgi:hypothetical protein